MQAYFPFQYNLKNYVTGNYSYSNASEFVEDSRDPERRRASLQLEKYNEVVISNPGIGTDS